VGANTVVVANQFNPSIVTQLWLVRNGLLKEDDFKPGCIFTDMVVHVKARDFTLMVVDAQCQFAPCKDRLDDQELVVDKVGSLVRLLPETPYRAVGLNFLWHLVPEDGDVPAISRGLFFTSDGPLHREFDDPTARFGAYMSKDAFGARLKLDVKPIIVEQDTVRKERIQFAFNLHLDIAEADDPVARIQGMLGCWSAVREETSRIVHTALREELA
jgi:hypothetical protein